MALHIARIAVAVFLIWIAVGVVFAAAFAVIGVDRVDHKAKSSSVGFRVMIVPATIALWPLLLARWLRGGGAAEECNAHRSAARTRQP